MGVCLSKQYVHAKNDYPLISLDGDGISGMEKSSNYLRICAEKHDMNSCRHLFVIPKRIQSSPSKLLGLFMRHVSSMRSKTIICHDLKIPRALCEHASSIEDDDLSPRLNEVKSGNSVTNSRCEDYIALRSTAEPSATEKCQAIQSDSGLSMPIAEDYTMKCSLQDRFEISENNVFDVKNQGNDGAFGGAEGIIIVLEEESSEETQGREAFGSPFSIDTCHGAETIKRSQQLCYISYSHQGQRDPFVSATTESPYSRSCQDNEDKTSEGTISDEITSHSKQYAVADSLASKAMMADPEYSEDTFSESSTDLFDLEFLSTDVLIGPCAD